MGSCFIRQDFIFLKMRKSDIRRGTLYIIGFSVLIFVLIHIFMKREADSPEESPKGFSVRWSDTLTNRSSEWKALYPMDKEIELFMQKWELKGMSVAVTRNDSLLYAKGYGWADREAGDKMEATSIMRMASASKLITAVAIMKLCEQGKLNLDMKVFGHEGILNDTSYTSAIRDQRIKEITVDHLLRHKGGFTLGAGDPMFNTKDIMAVKKLKTPPTNQELTKIVLGRRLGFMPGFGRRYSNFGYMLLSLVIEKVTGLSYWDYVDKEVLQPAGAYYFCPATNYYADRNKREVKYYPPDGELVEEYNGSGKMVERVYGGSNVNGLMGAGGWVASAADLARLVAAIDGDSRVGDVINANSVAAMTAHDDNDKMSRGWSEVDAKGKWSRTGTLSSTHALIERFPDGECWVILTNSGVWIGHRFSRDLSRLVERLRSRYDKDLPRRNLW